MQGLVPQQLVPDPNSTGTPRDEKMWEIINYNNNNNNNDNNNIYNNNNDKIIINDNNNYDTTEKIKCINAVYIETKKRKKQKKLVE